MKRSKTTLFLLCSLVMFCGLFQACSSSKGIKRDHLYFQKGLDSLGIVHFKEPRIQPSDLLSIQIFSKSLNQEQASLFNIPNTGASNANGYLVDVDGNIEIPIVGTIKAAGLTRAQLRNILTEKLSSLVRDPSVLIRFLEFKINVLGEVKIPGVQNFTTERVTIIDAITSAGDLTDAGKRQDVLVIREENGFRKSYNVDLRSAALFQSPVFQLQQNDIVYVGANNLKLKTLKTNPETQRSVQLGLSIASIVAFILSIIVTITR